jgi:phage repressor protein C with HTH and peptisase S24 domain
MDSVRKLISDRSRDLGKSLAQLSAQIGKNPAYLQQFIARGTPRRLNEDDRRALARLLDLSEESLRLAKVPVSTKLPQTRSNGKSSRTLSQREIPGRRLIGPDDDLPVYASTQGGHGVVIVSHDPVDWVARPEPLARVRDGYGVIVLEDSMSPEFEPGDIALVHPHKPPMLNRSCIFKSYHADGTIVAVIKRLERITADLWHVRQHNPAPGQPATFTLKRSDWQECHPTVGKYSNG